MSKTARTEAGRQSVVLIGDSITSRHHSIPTLDECRAIVAPLIEDIKRRADAINRLAGGGHAKTLDEARERIAAAGGIKRAEEAEDHWCELCGDSLTTLQHDEAIGYYRACSHCGSEYQGKQEQSMNSRPCRCGQDGCSDSVSCPRHNRTDG